MGYSIGKWIEDGRDRYAALEVETRNLKGPRTYDTTGLPLHPDNQTIVRERIHLDGADNDLLHHLRSCADAALDGRQALSPRARREVGRECMQRVQPPRLDPQRDLLSQRRRRPDAFQEGPAAAGSKVFQEAVSVSVRSSPRKRMIPQAPPPPQSRSDLSVIYPTSITKHGEVR